MVRVLLYLAVFAALAVGAVWLADRPGEVSVLWQGYRIETSVAIGAIGVVVLAMLAMLAWGLARFVLGLPTAFSFASRARRRARGFEAVSRGMVAIGAGDPIAAGRHAVDARRFAGDEPLTLLLEAQAAQLSGDRGRAEAAFKTMLDKPETRVLGLRGLFVEAKRRGDMAAARAFADDAVRRSPSLAWANDALLDFHTSAGDWQAARTAVERRAALRLADKADARRQRAVLLAAEALEARGSEPEKALAAALEATKLAPGLTPAAALAGRMLAERGDIRKAVKLLEAAWKEVSHPDIAAAYLDVRPGDSAQDRLARATTLAKLRPSDPEGVLAFAGAAIHARDFQKAREALKPLLAGGASVRVCLLMAELEEAEHGAAGRVREWLSRASPATAIRGRACLRQLDAGLADLGPARRFRLDGAAGDARQPCPGARRRAGRSRRFDTADRGAGRACRAGAGRHGGGRFASAATSCTCPGRRAAQAGGPGQSCVGAGTRAEASP